LHGGEGDLRVNAINLGSVINKSGGGNRLSTLQPSLIVSVYGLLVLKYCKGTIERCSVVGEISALARQERLNIVNARLASAHRAGVQKYWVIDKLTAIVRVRVSVMICSGSYCDK
jgi:hypothetical protein